MHLRPVLASTVLLSACWLVVGPAGPAAAVCDSYSGVCVDDETEIDGEDGGAADDGDQGGDDQGGGQGGDSGGPADRDTVDGGSEDTAVDDNRVLPFTGGELVLMTGIGAGALAGGTALVLAGRRKSTPSL